MIVNEKNQLKILDFGSSRCFGSDELTHYMVTRHYRAPEICLDIVYDFKGMFLHSKSIITLKFK